HQGPQSPRPLESAELSQCLGLDLPNPLARDIELLADLFERVLALAADAETQPLSSLAERVFSLRCPPAFEGTTGRARWFSTSGMSIRRPVSSLVGLWSSFFSSSREARRNLLELSLMCTGMRMVRDWSAMARVIAWRTHQVAYVENL